MRIIPGVFLSIALLTTGAVYATENGLPVRVRIPESVERGDVVPVTVDGPDISGMNVYLELPDGRRTEAAGRLVAASTSGNQRWQALAGIEHTASGGVAAVETVILSRGRVQRFRGDLVVIERAFVEEEIRLGAAMSELRETTDPRRAEESRILWELLHVINPERGYHSGPFILPVKEYRRTSGYGDRRVFRYVDGRTARTYHNGLDLAAPTGSPVIAPARGRVAMATDRLITGGTIVLEHQPGVYSLFYHLDTVDVTRGEIVGQGSRIATLGSTGLSTGPHLHWEIRVGGVAVDPEWFVRAPHIDTSDITGALSTIP